MVSQLSICFLVAVCALMCCCEAVPMQKRDAADDKPLVSDVNQSLDKFYEDLTKGIKQLATDGIDIQSVINNVTSKANEFGEQLQTLGKEINDKVQEAAKKQGLTN